MERILREFEEGQFQGACALVDALWRDTRIVSGMQTRVNTLLGLPLVYEPDIEGAEAQKIADEALKLHGRMFPEESLKLVLERGLLFGIGLGELLWDTKAEGRWLPRLKAWENHYLYWHWEKRAYVMQVQSGDAAGALGLTLEMGDPKWCFFAPWGLQRGWMRGLLRALALPWLVGRFSYRDWARYCETHGAPFKKAKVPSNQQKEVKDDFARQTATANSNSVVVCDVDEAGNGFDVTLVEAMSQTWDSFQGLLKQAEEAITLALLGQNLTTKVADGSRAAAQVHDTVRMDLLRADAMSLAKALKSQPIQYWVQFNFQSDATKAEQLAPCPSWQTEPPKDESQGATTLKTLADAFNGMRAAGVALDVRAILDEYKIPYTGDATAEPVTPAQPGQQDENQDEEQLSASNAPGWVKGQKYADKLVAHGVDEGQKALGGDVAELLALIRAAKSPQELKASLLEFYADMPVQRLGRIFSQVGILARLDGRQSVVEDL